MTKKEWIAELLEQGYKPYRIIRIIYGTEPTPAQERHVYQVAQLLNLKRERDELLKKR